MSSTDKKMAEHQAADTKSAWSVFTDSTIFHEMRPFDLVLKNGVKVYGAHYNGVHWPSVRDWRYAAIPSNASSVPT